MTNRNTFINSIKKIQLGLVNKNSADDFNKVTAYKVYLEPVTIINMEETGTPLKHPADSVIKDTCMVVYQRYLSHNSVQ